MSARFYNPGSRLTETYKFDNPTTDPKTQSNISYFHLDASARSFFEVPTEMTVVTENGEMQVSVRFSEQIQADYRGVGVVRINPKAKQPIGHDDNVAVNDKEAKEKGDRLWREASIELVRAHQRQVVEIRANGMLPLPARGATARALNELGIKDPANDVAEALEKKEDTSRIAQLEKKIEELLAAKAK